MKRLGVFIYQDFMKGGIVRIKAGYEYAGTLTKIVDFYHEPPSPVIYASLAPVISTARHVIDEWLVPIAEMEPFVATKEQVREIHNRIIMNDQYHIQVPVNWDGVERRKAARA